MKILKSINGLSLFGFGANWNIPKRAKTEVQELITFLENKRVLYNDYELEIPDHCVQSVIQIREEITQLLKKFPEEKGLSEHLRGVRASCRNFLNKVQKENRETIIREAFDGGPDHWKFFTAVGSLRSEIGIHLGLLCIKYRFKLEGELATILPPIEELPAMK